MSKVGLQEAVQPICALIKTMDFATDEIKHVLDVHYPLSSLGQIRTLVLQGINEGWLCPRGEQSLKYGRLQKSTSLHALGIDTVDMNGSKNPCAGPGHEHPMGEIDLCFALEGDPKFDGQPEGWTVYPPKSWHIPTVTNGRMAILYFLPDGAIRFGPPHSN
jgi:2-hydroxylaminobenzoate mutase